MNDDLKSLQQQLAKLTENVNRLAGDAPEPTFGEFLEKYQRQKMADFTLRESTRNAFADQAKHLARGFGHRKLKEIGNIVWLEWVSASRADPAMRVTRFFNARKTLIEVLHAAREEGLLERAPKLEIVDARKPIGRALSDAEIFRILHHTRKPMFRLFFFALAKMGCRPKEVLQWEWEMFRWGEPGKTWIAVPARITKTDRDRLVPVNPALSRRLYDLYRDGNGSKFVWPHRGGAEQFQTSYHGAWRTACRHAGVDAMPYDLRRTFITRAVARGMPAAFVARCLDTSVKMIEAFYLKQDETLMEKIMA